MHLFQCEKLKLRCDKHAPCGSCLKRADAIDRCNLYAYDQAWERLISSAVPQNQLSPLLETIFLEQKVHDIIDHLQGNEIQTFIDVIGAVSWHHAFLPPKNELIDHCSNFCTLLVRRWITLISLHRFEGNA